MWWTWVWDGFLSGAGKMLTLWWLVPFFIVFQLLKDSGWLNRLDGLMKPILKPLRLPGEAGLPVVATVTVGLSYGAGILLQTAEEGRLKRNELTVACVFVGICHAVIEETMLFSAAGTSGLLVVVVRAVVGLLFGIVASRIYLKPAA